MSKPIFFHVYVSSAVKPFSDEELLKLLQVSRLNNEKANITGLLLYRDGNFMQVLEGDEDQVNAVMKKIESDTRHYGIIPLINGTAGERQFSEWSMGFRDLNSPELKSVAGFSEFLNTPLTGAEFQGNPSRCQRLLLTFKKNMR